MTRFRSLADELAELLNPTPRGEIDPEAAGLAEVDQLGASDDELAGLLAQTTTERRAVAADIAIAGGDYAGRRSSRAALFNDSNVPGGDSGSNSGSSQDEDGNEQHDPPGGPNRIRYARHEHAPLPPGRRDLSSIPTMFVNGHKHGPGPDDPTSSSSSMLSNDADSSADDGEQLGRSGDISEYAAVVATGTDVLHSVPLQTTLQRGVMHSSSHFNSTHAATEGGAEIRQPAMLDTQDNQQQQEQGRSHISKSSEDEAAGDHTAFRSPEQQQQVQVFAATSAAEAVAAVRNALGDDDEMQQLEREAAAVHAEAAEQCIAAGARGGRDMEKSEGVRAQQHLWGSALELRIRLQKALSGANVLPRPATRSLLLAEDKLLAQKYTELLASCRHTLQDMLHLHHTLAQQHPAAAAALAAVQPHQQEQQQQQSDKRRRAAAGLEAEVESTAGDRAVNWYATCCNAGDAWAAVDAAIGGLAGFRDASLDRWHRRTVLASGTAALRGSSGLRALQQSVSSQVAALMADKAKLISRSQVPVQLAPRPLGQPAAAAAAQGSDQATMAALAAAKHERQRDPETYDEGDFYQQLLKELIDSAPSGSYAQHLAGARAPKRRKVVDRRASKGRKIRYHTLEKLVGFMAPAELVLPPFAQQLFGALFSHVG